MIIIRLLVDILIVGLMAKLHCIAHTIDSGSILIHSLEYSMVSDLQLLNFYKISECIGCYSIHVVQTRDWKSAGAHGAEEYIFPLFNI